MKTLIRLYCIALFLICSAAFYVPAEQIQTYEIICTDSTGTDYTYRYDAIARYDVIEEIHVCGNDKFKEVGE